MVEKYFQHLYEIKGIEAFALLDNNKQIIYHWIHSKYDSPIFSEIGESYIRIFALAQAHGIDMDEVVTLFDRGTVFVRNHERFFLVIIGNPHVDISHIRLAVNVSLFEIDESKRIQKMLRKLPPQKPDRFDISQLDDAERVLINRILESGNAR